MKTWIAIARITEESGHYTKLVKMHPKYDNQLIDNMVLQLIKDNWGWDEAEDITYVADRCTVYIFRNSDYVNKIQSMNGTSFSTEWADVVEAEIMSHVYGVFADIVIEPKKAE